MLCSQHLADKVFLKNDLGQDNIELINEQLFHGDINEDDKVNIIELSNFLNDLYSECVARGSVNNTKISNSIGSLKNLFTINESNDDVFNDDFFTFENYNWRERAAVLNVNQNVDELLQVLDKNKAKNKKTKTPDEKAKKRQAKQSEFNKIYKMFIEKLKSTENEPGSNVKCSSFCKQFYNERVAAVTPGECVPHFFTLRDWFYNYHKKCQFAITTQGGRRDKHVKHTVDVIHV